MNAPLVFIESNTTGTGMLALRRATDLGYTPVLLTADPTRYHGLAETGAVVVPCDTDDSEALVAAARSLPKPALAGITTTSEFFLIAVAETAERLGLPGNPAAVVRACRDKGAVRGLLAEAGLAQPRHRVLGRGEAVRPALNAVGLPCVVKPVGDSGSNDVLICRTAEQAERQAARVLAVTHNVRGQPTAGLALIEQYIEGPEYSVELFSVDGRHLAVGVTERTLTAPPYCVEQRHVYRAALDPAAEAALAEIGGRVLAATGVRWGPTHLEVRLGPDGPMPIELNCRLAGGMIPDLVRLVDGVDLLEQQIRCAAGLEPVLGARSRGCAGVQFFDTPAEGVLHALEGVREAEAIPGVTRLTVSAVPGTWVRPARSAYDRTGFAVAHATGRARLDTILDEVRARVVPVLEPRPGTTPTARPAAA